MYRLISSTSINLVRKATEHLSSPRSICLRTDFSHRPSALAVSLTVSARRSRNGSGKFCGVEVGGDGAGLMYIQFMGQVLLDYTTPSKLYAKNLALSIEILSFLKIKSDREFSDLLR